jgi:3-oxoacid CoA-transferase B subunit
VPPEPDPAPSKRERIAAAVAAHLSDGWLVNVGIGLPGLVPHHVPDERGITFHAEHGVVGFGSDRFGPDGEALAFFGTTYRLRPGGFIGDSSRSFAIIRAGMLDATVLGAFEVAADGRMANWQGIGMASGCPGGSPELAGCARRVIVAVEHTDRSGRPRLVADTGLAVGVDRPADLIVTELGTFVPTGVGFRVVRLADGVGLDDAARVTGAELEAGVAP